MATEKRHKQAASTSKGGSLIIQLPTTSANNLSDTTLLSQNNSNNSELEQNNLFNECRRISEVGQHLARTQIEPSEQVARDSAPPPPPLQAPNQPHHNHQHHNHHHHRNHLNNFHNHIQQQQQQGRHSSETSRGHYSERLAAQTETESDQESITPPPHYHEIPGIVPAYQGRSSGPPPAYEEVINPNAMPPSYQSLFGQMREARKKSNGLVDLLRQLFLVLIGTIGCTMIIGFLLLIPVTMILVGIVYVNDCRAENIPFFLVIGGFVWIVKNALNCYNQFKKDASNSNRPPPRRHPISAVSQTQQQLQPSGLQNVDFSHSGSNISQGNVLIVETADATSGSYSNQASASSSGSSSETVATTSVESSPSTTTRRHTQPSSQQNNRIRHPPMIGLTSYKCESILNYFLIVWFLAGCIVVYRIYEPDYDNPASANYCNRLVYLYAFWLMTSAFIVTAIILSCLCCLMASSLLSYRR